MKFSLCPQLWFSNLYIFATSNFEFSQLKSYVWNCKGLRHQVARILGLKKLRLWQRLNSFHVLFITSLIEEILTKTKMFLMFSEKNKWSHNEVYFWISLCVIVIYIFICLLWFPKYIFNKMWNYRYTLLTLHEVRFIIMNTI